MVANPVSDVSITLRLPLAAVGNLYCKRRRGGGEPGRGSSECPGRCRPFVRSRPLFAVDPGPLLFNLSIPSSCGETPHDNRRDDCPDIVKVAICAHPKSNTTMCSFCGVLVTAVGRGLKALWDGYFDRGYLLSLLDQDKGWHAQQPTAQPNRPYDVRRSG